MSKSLTMQNPTLVINLTVTVRGTFPVVFQSIKFLWNLYFILQDTQSKKSLV